ncbi:DUF4296 domain-containing protein [Bacteroides sp. 519]|nr:DUF4296 domain-containing protein [Bacteroides sp. 519]
MSCGIKRPKDVIPESTMEQLLYDYHIAKAMGDGLPYNENYKKALYVEDVFKKYGTTQAAFDSSMVWYTRNTEVLSKVYEKVSKRLKNDLNDVKRLISIRDNKPMVSESGDSINVWFLEKIYRLTGHPLNNKITFNLPSDTNFYDRDTLSWQVNYNFLGHEVDSNRAAIMAMHIIYDNDSIISDIRKIVTSGMDTIRLHSDTLGKIKEIKGFIYYNAKDNSVKPLWIDSISLMRYHSQDTLTTRTDTVVATEKILKPEPEKIKPIEPTEVLQEQPQRMERARPSSVSK